MSLQPMLYCTAISITIVAMLQEALAILVTSPKVSWSFAKFYSEFNDQVDPEPSSLPFNLFMDSRVSNWGSGSQAIAAKVRVRSIDLSDFFAFPLYLSILALSSLFSLDPLYESKLICTNDIDYKWQSFPGCADLHTVTRVRVKEGILPRLI